MKSPNERESAILKYWQDNNIFQKSLDKNKDKEVFRYYDGPPYATGLPHFGNALPTAIKDMYPRYKTMRGFNVPRSWGWDCHGLPIENLAEKTLGFKGKKDIEEAGVKLFNETARASVFKFRDDWKKIIPRLGRWADMDNDYRTLDASFMESNIWAFKELHSKGLVYEGYKVMPWCPHCETVLSNYEVTEGYKEISDLSAYAYFKLIDGEYKDA
ncbi:class I tRNA ligase family protein, partial [Candidatus Parcubacteria bacterium]|nr:class I tRNA ligase family protein [Candidatus Parcubacteria bacterium]